ncbi:iron uptake system protein EfeO [Listeria booriae]|uniref:EfeM/EfeO family lipoprotein n=1 Tax=Listeria booriae TaxID=1552123 RepID=A0A7X1CV57_9LIST|nr:iron uptake system protein EfeO [Listeria booriae]MBC1575738.1 EfeM/EfeO family lipoprotein [Listeria booriae]MBC1798387.1 EfeM/EfeO family lipoprotein [Listeria booriae]MBC1800646.1 EfeM/EfeO family lipoprotein [Listeria booriae]MBC1887549.1 EfeM/EfeO family lipoprotein [Listeria booriae]MBC1890632.1 EfeM/EfeO family lipoprotein [Listeria booriae]
MRKIGMLCMSVLAAVLVLAACNSNDGASDTKADAKKEQTDSKQATAVKKDVKQMQDELATVEKDIAAKNDADVKNSAAAMHKHWLAFENNVRDLYPLLYTDVEKYETPIFYMSKRDKLDYAELATNAASLKTSLEAVASAKETKAKTSEVLDKAVDNYSKYVVEQTAAFVGDTKIFADAVKAGDTAKAKEYYSKARVYYERIEPIAESFGDLDPKLDARINDVDDQTEWTGFHRIEKALWQDNSLAGMDKYADQLVTDSLALQAEVGKLKLEPKPMVAGAMELLNEAATTKITGEEEAYSHTDLVDLAANVEGSKVVYQAIIPALNANDKDLTQQIDDAFVKMEDTLEKYNTDGNYVSYDKLTPEQIREISNQLSHLSELMAQTGKIF